MQTIQVSIEEKKFLTLNDAKTDTVNKIKDKIVNTFDPQIKGKTVANLSSTTIDVTAEDDFAIDYIIKHYEEKGFTVQKLYGSGNKSNSCCYSYICCCPINFLLCLDWIFCCHDKKVKNGYGGDKSECGLCFGDCCTNGCNFESYPKLKSIKISWK